MNVNEDLVAHTAKIVAAYAPTFVGHVDDIAPLIFGVYNSLSGLGMPPAPVVVVAKPIPVVSVRASVKPDHLVCLACGAKHKMLKRHIMASHGMTPEEYRESYSLASSYSLVAPDYSKHRSKLAKQNGLGIKSVAK